MNKLRGLFISKSIESLRLSVFYSLILFSICLFFLPFSVLFINPARAEFATIFNFTKVISPLWLPLLASFTGFFFSTKRESVSTKEIEGFYTLLVFTLLFFYFLISISMISYFVFFFDTDELSVGQNVDDLLKEFVNWMLIISPAVFYAPIYYLTGSSEKK